MQQRTRHQWYRPNSQNKKRIFYQAYKKFKKLLLQKYPLLRNKMCANVPFRKITFEKSQYLKN